MSDVMSLAVLCYVGLKMCTIVNSQKKKKKLPATTKSLVERHLEVPYDIAPIFRVEFKFRTIVLRDVS